MENGNELNYIENERLYRQLAQKLIKQISQGVYKPGERLPSEHQLCVTFGVSRTVVREAIIMMEVLGHIEVRKGVGIFVTKQKPIDAAPQEEDIGPFELLQARQAVESQIAEIAALMIGKRDVVALKRAIELEKKEFEKGIYQGEGDYLFHLGVAQATQNAMLVSIVSQLWKKRTESPMWRQLSDHIEHKNEANDWSTDHQKILEALVKKSPAQARQVMWQHFENIKQRLYELSDSDSTEFDGFLFPSIPNVPIEL